jgi:hypothetical protein
MWDGEMTQAEIECLKSNVGQIVEIETLKGERLLIKPISVFDNDSDPDIFFWDLTSDQVKTDSHQTQGCALPLSEIVSVKLVR